MSEENKLSNETQSIHFIDWLQIQLSNEWLRPNDHIKTESYHNELKIKQMNIHFNLSHRSRSFVIKWSFYLTLNSKASEMPLKLLTSTIFDSSIIKCFFIHNTSDASCRTTNPIWLMTNYVGLNHNHILYMIDN